jgi:hypothetical protein
MSSIGLISSMSTYMGKLRMKEGDKKRRQGGRGGDQEGECEGVREEGCREGIYCASADSCRKALPLSCPVLCHAFFIVKIP